MRRRDRPHCVCLVPFCDRWTGGRKNDAPSGFDWICWTHWKPLPLAWRKVWKRAHQRLTDARTFGRSTGEGTIAFDNKARFIEHLRARDAEERLWQRLRRAAIDRGLGITAGARPRRRL